VILLLNHPLLGDGCLVEEWYADEERLDLEGWMCDVGHGASCRLDLFYCIAFDMSCNGSWSVSRFLNLINGVESILLAFAGRRRVRSQVLEVDLFVD